MADKEKKEKEVKEENKEAGSELKKEKKDKQQKEIDSLQAKLEESKAQAEEFKDKYYRAVAELDNQRKQYAKEYSQTLKYASSSRNRFTQQLYKKV